MKLRMAALAVVFALGAGAALPSFATVVAGVRLDPVVQTPAGALALLACGVRNTLWIRHYIAALYAPAGSSAQVVADPRTPKVVRMHVVEDRFLPNDVPEKWREPLERELPAREMQKVREVFAKLSSGDVLTVTYLPRRGVSLRVNGRDVGQVEGHSVVDAILTTWAENEPLSDRIERFASKSRC
jgi:hypothetical protein